MKKIIALLIVFVMILTASSCVAYSMRQDRIGDTEITTDGTYALTELAADISDDTKTEIPAETVSIETMTAGPEPDEFDDMPASDNLSGFKEVIEKSFAVYQYSEEGSVDEGYRYYAGMPIVQNLVDYQIKKDDLWKKILPENYAGLHMTFFGMPEIYYWIKYEELKEEDVRRVNQQLSENYIKNEHDDKGLIANLLTDEDISVLYHGTDDEIKKQFRLPFCYIRADGMILTPYQVYHAELKDEELAEYRKIALDDLIKLSINNSFYNNWVGDGAEYSQNTISQWLYELLTAPLNYE